MEKQNEFSSISLKSQTVEKLKTIKSCFQIARKQNINYDELINQLIDNGLPLIDKKVHKIYELSEEDDQQENKEEDTEIQEVNDEHQEE